MSRVSLLLVEPEKEEQNQISLKLYVLKMFIIGTLFDIQFVIVIE